jgi:serine protease inhibitor
MDKIRELLPPAALNADTRLVLVNAMYLGAPWASPFPRATRRATRRSSWTATADAQAPTMSPRNDLTVAAGPGFRAVELPYRGAELAMDILLPDARDGLAALEAQLTASASSRPSDALAPPACCFACRAFTSRRSPSRCASRSARWA